MDEEELICGSVIEVLFCLVGLPLLLTGGIAIPCGLEGESVDIPLVASDVLAVTAHSL
jgi:hypothetical protein